MTTAAEIKKLVKPLLARNADLALVKRFVVVTPLRHVIRGVLMDGTSGKHGFLPRWLVDHFFEPRRRYHLSWGECLRHSTKGWVWYTTEAGIEEELILSVEGQALPLLRALESLDDFVATVAQTDRPHLLFEVPVEKIVLDIARGDLATARGLSRDVIAKKSLDDPHLDDEDREHLRKVKVLCALLEKDDRAGMARMLHEWEAETVRLMKLDHLWEPSPFPLEMM
jgi:hypothetical protein